MEDSEKNSIFLFIFEYQIPTKLGVFEVDEITSSDDLVLLLLVEGLEKKNLVDVVDVVAEEALVAVAAEHSLVVDVLVVGAKLRFIYVVLVDLHLVLEVEGRVGLELDVVEEEVVLVLDELSVLAELEARLELEDHLAREVVGYFEFEGRLIVDRCLLRAAEELSGVLVHEEEILAVADGLALHCEKRFLVFFPFQFLLLLYFL